MGQERAFVILIAMIILGSLLALFALFWFTWRWSQRSHSVSPYTGVPLRRAIDIPYSSAEKALRFLYDKKQYDNRIFALNHAAFCRETGRIFQDCMSWFDIIHVDWSFLKKRYPGHYVSWGSLTREQQQELRRLHSSLDAFQTEESSPLADPRMIESDYAYTKPGPLYVDLQTHVLLGWQIVPGTEFEVLVVQKPLTSKI
jgi:hypothetical protein